MFVTSVAGPGVPTAQDESVATRAAARMARARLPTCRPYPRRRVRSSVLLVNASHHAALEVAWLRAQHQSRTRSVCPHRREEETTQRSPEIEHLVAAWFDAATRGDVSMVSGHVSQHEAARLIGSDPGELFTGGAAVAEFLEGEVRSAGGNATFAPTGTEAFSEGTVGWATTSVRITMSDGRHVSPRWSAVFHQEDGVWKFSADARFDRRAQR